MQAATVVINRRALRHNLQRLRELAPASKLVAVVKANAYGHGLLETARTLTDADAFGVARLEEALRLGRYHPLDIHRRGNSHRVWLSWYQHYFVWGMTAGIIRELALQIGTRP